MAADSDSEASAAASEACSLAAMTTLVSLHRAEKKITTPQHVSSTPDLPALGFRTRLL